MIGERGRCCGSPHSPMPPPIHCHAIHCHAIRCNRQSIAIAHPFRPSITVAHSEPLPVMQFDCLLAEQEEIGERMDSHSSHALPGPSLPSHLIARLVVCPSSHSV